MKIKTQIALTLFLALFAVTGICLAIALYHIRSNSDHDIAASRKMELERTQAHLKDVVDISFSLLENQLALTNDMTWVETHYGPALRLAVTSADSILSQVLISPPAQEQQKTLNAVMQRHFNQLPTAFFIARTDDGKILACNTAASHFNQAKIAEFIRTKTPSVQPKFIFSHNPVMPRISYLQTFPAANLAILAAVSADEIQRDAMERSKNLLRNCRFAQESGYIFVIGTDCVCIIHPLLPHLEGSDMSMIRDSFRKPLFAEMSKLCLKSNEGFIFYHWSKPRPDKPDLPEVPKVSYVKLFKPWMWIIGCGAYLDNISEIEAQKETAMREQAEALIQQTFLWISAIAIIILLLVWYLSRSLSRPLEQLLRAMKNFTPNSNKNLNLSLRGATEVVQLGEVFNRLGEKITESINQIKTTTDSKEKAENELKLAGEIQNGLIPKMFPPITTAPEFEISTINIPAVNGGTGICDCFQIDPDHIGIIMSSLSRCGVAGTIYNVMLRTMLRGRALSIASPGTILNNVNEILQRNRKLKVYISIFFGIINLRSGEMLYTNAGHSFPLIYRKSGQLEDLPTHHGEALCVHRNHFYAYDRTFLCSDDILLLYSDGLLRCANHGQGMPADDFRRKIMQCLHRTPEETVTQCILTVEEMFSSVSPAEDVSLLTIHYHGRPEEPKEPPAPITVVPENDKNS